MTGPSQVTPRNREEKGGFLGLRGGGEWKRGWSLRIQFSVKQDECAPGMRCTKQCCGQQPRNVHVKIRKGVPRQVKCSPHNRNTPIVFSGQGCVRIGFRVSGIKKERRVDNTQGSLCSLFLIHSLRGGQNCY